MRKIANNEICFTKTVAKEIIIILIPLLLDKDPRQSNRFESDANFMTTVIVRALLQKQSPKFFFALFYILFYMYKDG
jgi:hypothetical protein